MNEKTIGTVCFYLGFVSITASIALWMLAVPQDGGHAERMAIFVGLWAPTFFALANRWK
jgi:hypothetical protein